MKRLVFALLLVVSVAPWTAAQNAPTTTSPDSPALSMFEGSDRWSHLRDFRDDSSDHQVLTPSPSALRDQVAVAAKPSPLGEGGPSGPGEGLRPTTSTIQAAPPSKLIPAPALPTRINLDFDAVSLTNVLQFLSDSTGAAIVVDPRLKADTGKAADDEQVTLHIKAVTLQQALDLVVPAEMGWHVTEGRILVSSREKANPLVLHTYSIRDLITPVPDFGDSAPHFDLAAAMSAAGSRSGGGGGGGLFKEDAKEEAADPHPEQKIIALIKKFVTTGNPRIAAWDDAGGLATIEYFNGQLIVNQTDAGHRKVIDLLSKL